MVKSSDTLPNDAKLLQEMYLDVQDRVLKREAEVSDLSDQISSLDGQIIELREVLVAKDEELAKKNESLAEKDESLAEKEQTIEMLLEQLTLLRSKRFQSQSEQLRKIQGQLFDESELEAAIRDMESELSAMESKKNVEKEGKAPKKKQKPRRKSLPSALRRVDVIVDVSAEDKQMMGDDWEWIGYEDSEQLAVIDRQIYVRRHRRAKYARKPGCGDGDRSPGIKVAPAAPVMLPKSMADGSLLADILVRKFVDGLSFYQVDRQLQRDGIDIGYSTICDWPIQLERRLDGLKPLIDQALSEQALWHLDETTLQVLGETGRDNEKKSYLWGIRAGPPERAIISFHYSPRRNYEVLKTWLSPALEGFDGVIVSDDHKPYNTLVSAHAQIRGHGGCWAHCRRKFSEAAKGRRHTSDAHQVLMQIAKLYRLEDTLAELSGAALVAARREKLVPHLDQMKETLEGFAKVYVDKGLMKTAVGYALNQWDKLTAFLDHEVMPLDNNAMEQAIRPFTIGRRRWLFSGSPRGASASAFFYSLIETAKANGWEPKRYLEVLFERYPQVTSDDERRALLPFNLSPSER